MIDNELKIAETLKSIKHNDLGCYNFGFEEELDLVGPGYLVPSKE